MQGHRQDFWGGGGGGGYIYDCSLTTHANNNLLSTLYGVGNDHQLHTLVDPTHT